MDTVAILSQHLGQRATATTSPTMTETEKTLAVTAAYLLSEEGRKASLLAGGDGRAVQQLTLHVPTNRLHLVTVDLDGVARLKLRPRYQVDGEQRIVRIDAAPTYDAPPDIEELFREAARNHQLERAYLSERRTATLKRREAERERRTQVAQAFQNDPAQRALVHPAPSPKRCYVATEQGRLLFDAATDEGVAKQVPAEAHRRFRADLRVRKERNYQDRATQLALHEEKKRYIGEWIDSNGTPDQRERQTAGVLPIEEAVEAITGGAFEAAADYPLYTRDGAERLQAHLRRSAQYADVIVTPDDLVVTGSDAAKASAAQWAILQQLQTTFPDATVMLRVHRLALRRDPQAPSLAVFGVLVTRRVGPFTLRREYAAPDAEWA